MMWYSKFAFVSKEEGLKDINVEYLYEPYTNDELESSGVKQYYPDHAGKAIPKEIIIPNEYMQLLRYSNGGLIVNGEREFGYFSLQELRTYYFLYGFPKWAPLFLPVAFNGGGKFYAYDFRNRNNKKIIAVSSSDLDYDSSVILGSNLEEVLSNITNIEDELSTLYKRPEPSEAEKTKNGN